MPRRPFFAGPGRALLDVFLGTDTDFFVTLGAAGVTFLVMVFFADLFL